MKDWLSSALSCFGVRTFGWDLPPGVTQKMIDDQAEGEEPVPKGMIECDGCDGRKVIEDEDGKWECPTCEGRGIIEDPGE